MTRRQKIFILSLFLIILLCQNTLIGFFNSSKIYQITETTAKDNALTELKEKYDELTTSYAYDDFYYPNLEHTKVLYRSLYHFNEILTIYKGSANNLEPDMVVINEKGLVGYLSKVDSHCSEVTLLTNPNYYLPVKINSSYGLMSYQNASLIVSGIKASTQIEEGDKVYLSDLSKYPSHIFIGTVSQIKLNNYEIEKIITITPAVDFSSLSYLSVITTLRGIK